jgi:hypothetical protein
MQITRLASAFFSICSLLCACGAGAERLQQNSAPPSAQRSDEQSKAQAEPKGQAEKGPRAAIDPNKFAIVVAGVGGEEAYSKKFSSQAGQLFDALTLRLGFDEKNVSLLVENVNGGPENGSRDTEHPTARRATADEVRKAFASIKSAAKADSLIFVALIGHGSSDAQQAKFNLVGPDLTAKDYAQLLGELPTRRVVFVNCASSSGDFIKPLSGENRVVITATRSGNEQNATTFAEHFIAAITSDGADADKNGRVSVLEAFTYASKVTADWYKQKNRLATEHALIDDNGDGVGHEEAGAKEGVQAKTLYLDSKTVEQAGSDAEVARLLGERQRLEEAVEKLKARKAEMKPEAYEKELEDLLVELATVNQSIKARKK